MRALRRISIKHKGAWSPVTDVYTKYDGVWRKVDDGYIKFQGKWWLVHDPDGIKTISYIIRIEKVYDGDGQTWHYQNFNLLDYISTHQDTNGVLWPRETFRMYPFKIHVTIESDVIIKGPFVIPSGFEGSTRIILKNYGSIYGLAGKGGDALPSYSLGPGPNGKTSWRDPVTGHQQEYYLGGSVTGLQYGYVMSAYGRDGTDGIENHSNLTLHNYGKISGAGGGGHGGIPNIGVGTSQVSFNNMEGQMMGWWTGKHANFWSGWQRSSSPAWFRWFQATYPWLAPPGTRPFYDSKNACGGGYLAKQGTNKSWWGSPSETSINYWLSEYNYDFSRFHSISGSSSTEAHSHHGGNGGGGAGFLSEAGEYKEVLKPIGDIGNSNGANTWGVMRVVLNAVASSVHNGADAESQVLAGLKSYQSEWNFTVHSVSLATGKVYWSLPGRHLRKNFIHSRVWGWGGGFCYTIENIGAHYMGLSISNALAGLSKNYYRLNWVDSPARQQSYTLGTAGTSTTGGTGGKTTQAGKTTPDTAWFNAWNGQAGDGGGLGEDGESLVIPASSYNGVTLPSITIAGGKGGAAIRTYNTDGSFTLALNDGEINGSVIYS